jgi:hypothetical protein
MPQGDTATNSQCRTSRAEENRESSERHLIIAGTGRSGTSFLVRYLTELGLDTTLARNGEEGAGWSLEANAGLETLGLGTTTGNLPYVIKSPWVGEYVDKILAEKRFKIDAFIVPVRNLVEAATSRAVLELRAAHQGHPWMAEHLDRSWETFAYTPGGIIYSLNPLDQARLLAIQFHQMVFRVSEAEIPIVFPVFPRIIKDWEYLHRCLGPVLPRNITSEIARSAHARVADVSKVRVEVADIPGETSSAYERSPDFHYPSPVEVDNMALRREISRLRGELSSQAATRIGLERERDRLQSAISELTDKASGKSVAGAN